MLRREKKQDVVRLERDELLVYHRFGEDAKHRSKKGLSLVKEARGTVHSIIRLDPCQTRSMFRAAFFAHLFRSLMCPPEKRWEIGASSKRKYNHAVMMSQHLDSATLCQYGNVFAGCLRTAF